MNFAPTDEQKMVREMVRKFAEAQIKPVAAELDRTHRHPEEICRQLGEMGLMGVAVPTEYDGAGMDNVTYVMALIEISKACASCGVITSVNNSLYGYPVRAFGTEEQKRKFLAPVAGGKVEGCYALTESSAGSDAAALKCRAELKGDRYIVNGVKVFITSGNIARYCVLAATTDPARGYRAIINPECLDLGLQAIIAIQVRHSTNALANFERGIAGVQGVRACYRISGTDDYILHVARRDLTQLGLMTKQKLASIEGVGRIETMWSSLR